MFSIPQQKCYFCHTYYVMYRSAFGFDKSKILPRGKQLIIEKDCSLRIQEEERFSPSEIFFYATSVSSYLLNPLPHMQILGSSESAANKNIMTKIWTNGLQLSD